VPQPFADHRRQRISRQLRFRRGQQPSRGRPDAQHLEEVAVHELRAHRDRPAVRETQRDFAQPVGRHSVEQRRLAAHGVEVRERETERLRRFGFPPVMKAQIRRFARRHTRHRAQQQLVQHPEHRRSRADADRERQDTERDERRCPRQ
jgi:hypothetical protein